MKVSVRKQLNKGISIISLKINASKSGVIFGYYRIKWDIIALNGEKVILLTYDLYMRTAKGEIRSFKN